MLAFSDSTKTDKFGKHLETQKSFCRHVKLLVVHEYIINKKKK